MDMLSAVVNDLKVGVCMMPCYVHGDREQIKEAAKTKLDPISKWLGAKKYLMGDNLCYVDFVMLECLCVIDWVSEGQCFTDYSLLKPYYARLRAIPEIQTALDNAEKKAFNNPFAKLNTTINPE